jgi:hypothetical protein
MTREQADLKVRLYEQERAPAQALRRQYVEADL